MVLDGRKLAQTCPTRYVVHRPPHKEDLTEGEKLRPEPFECGPNHLWPQKSRGTVKIDENTKGNLDNYNSGESGAYYGTYAKDHICILKDQWNYLLGTTPQNKQEQVVAYRCRPHGHTNTLAIIYTSDKFWTIIHQVQTYGSSNRRRYGRVN